MPSCDVLVIGGGLAGIQTAEVAAQFVGDVLLVDAAEAARAPASRRDAALLAAYLAQDAGGVSDWKSRRVHLGVARPAGAGPEAEPAVAAQQRGFEAFVREVLEHGAGLADPTLVEYTAAGIYNRIGWLESYGLDVARTPERLYRGFPAPGHGAARVVLIEQSADEVLQKIGESAERFGVRRAEGLRVTQLVSDAEGVRGALALDVSTVDTVAIEAGAVVLACGGADRLYRAEARGSAGAGYRLALGAGAELANLEFVAFCPELEAEPSPPGELLLVLLGLGATLEAADGAPLGGVRDPAALAGDLGRVLEQGPVRLRVPSDALRVVSNVPWVVPLLPLLEKPAALRPGCRGLLGGVVHDVFATSVPGLFVAGSVATGCHGADLLPGMATSAVLYSAENAASAAVAHATRTPRRGVPERLRRSEERRLAARLQAGRPAEPGERAGLEASLRELLWKHVGVVRSAEGLKSAIAELEALGERVDELRASAPQELAAHLDLEDLVHGALLVGRSALARAETRGGHVRSDCPQRDEAGGRSWIAVRRGDAGLEWLRIPVPGEPSGRARP